MFVLQFHLKTQSAPLALNFKTKLAALTAAQKVIAADWKASVEQTDAFDGTVWFMRGDLSSVSLVNVAEALNAQIELGSLSSAAQGRASAMAPRLLGAVGVRQ